MFTKRNLVHVPVVDFMTLLIGLKKEMGKEN